MKKITLLLLLISSICVGNAQNTYKVTNGEISFFSKTPVEDIDAVNKKVLGVIKNNEFAFVATIVGFKFKKPLMEEHFNENYMESDKYKTASFKGKIAAAIDLSKDGEYKTQAVGVLTMHGESKDRTIDGVFTVKDGKINLKSEFDVQLKDHKIDIPKLVIKKIAETVKVTVNIDFEPKK
jgi:YceI-like domain